MCLNSSENHFQPGTNHRTVPAILESGNLSNQKLNSWNSKFGHFNSSISMRKTKKRPLFHLLNLFSQKRVPFFNVCQQTAMLFFCHPFLSISSLFKMSETDFYGRVVALTSEYVCLQKTKKSTLFCQFTLVATILRSLKKIG